MKTITITVEAYTLNELSANPMEHAIGLLENMGINIPSAEMFVEDTQILTESRQAIKFFLNEILGADMFFEGEKGNDIFVSFIENYGEPITRGVNLRDQNLIGMCPEFPEMPKLIEAMKCTAEDVITLDGIVGRLENLDLMSSAMTVAEDQREFLSELGSLATQVLATLIEEGTKAARFNEANRKGILFDVDGNIVQS